MHIHLNTDPFPPPNAIQLTTIGPSHLTFHWDSLHLNCPTIKYIITTTENCGICPNNTTHTSLTCNNLTVSGQTCSYFIQTEICENLIGRRSEPLIVKLRGKH